MGLIPIDVQELLNNRCTKQLQISWAVIYNKTIKPIHTILKWRTEWIITSVTG